MHIGMDSLVDSGGSSHEGTGAKKRKLPNERIRKKQSRRGCSGDAEDSAEGSVSNSPDGALGYPTDPSQSPEILACLMPNAAVTDILSADATKIDNGAQEAPSSSSEKASPTFPDAFPPQEDLFMRPDPIGLVAIANQGPLPLPSRQNPGVNAATQQHVQLLTAAGGGLDMSEFMNSSFIQSLVIETLIFHLSCGRYRCLVDHVLDAFRKYSEVLIQQNHTPKRNEVPEAQRDAKMTQARTETSQQSSSESTAENNISTKSLSKEDKLAMRSKCLYPLPSPLSINGPSPLTACPVRVPVLLVLQNKAPNILTSFHWSKKRLKEEVSHREFSRSDMYPNDPSGVEGLYSSLSSRLCSRGKNLTSFEEKASIYEMLYRSRDASWCRRYFHKYQNDFDESIEFLNCITALLPLRIIRRLIAYHSMLKCVQPLPLMCWIASSNRNIDVLMFSSSLASLARQVLSEGQWDKEEETEKSEGKTDGAQENEATDPSPSHTASAPHDTDELEDQADARELELMGRLAEKIWDILEEKLI